MKKFTLHLFVCIAAFIASAVPAMAGSLSITVADVTDNDANITVVPTDVANYFFTIQEKEIYDANGGDEGAVEARINIWKRYGDMYDSPWTDFISMKTGERTFRADDFVTLEKGVAYVAYAFGIEADGTITSEVASATFTPGAPTEPFELSVSRISVRDAYITITPDNSDTNYMWGVVKKELVERAGGLDGLYEYHDKAWWEFLAETYSITWQEAAANEKNFGPRSGLFSELADDNLDWDTDYVLYAYYLDDNFAPASEVYSVDFKTLAAEKADLTFDIELLRVEADESRPGYNKATVRVMPSNDTDTWGTHIMDAYFYDFYVGNEQFTMTDFLQNQVYPYIVSTRTGTQDLTFLNISPSKDYVVVAVGYDTAPTTDDFALIRFPGAVYSAIDRVDNDADNVAVAAYGRNIFIDGDYTGAAVFTADGRCIATATGKTAIPAAPGIYIVKVTTPAGTTTRKVIVR